MKTNYVQSIVVLFLLTKEVGAQLGVLDWIADLICWVPLFKLAFCDKCAEGGSNGEDCDTNFKKDSNTVAPLGPQSGITSKPSHAFNWRMVANNNVPIPGSGGERNYNSYNPPSVNTNGLVVFRARTKGHQGGPFSGIYLKDSRGGKPAEEIFMTADRNFEVSEPNNEATTL